MANLSESATWEAGIYQIETTDPVQGGASGVSNTQGKQLANRTKYLKDHVDALEASSTTLLADVATLQADVDTAETMLNAIKGGATNLTQSIVSCKYDSNGDVAIITYVAGSLPGTPHQVTVNGSDSEPLVLAISGGYATNNPVNYW